MVFGSGSRRLRLAGALAVFAVALAVWIPAALSGARVGSGVFMLGAGLLLIVTVLAVLLFSDRR